MDYRNKTVLKGLEILNYFRQYEQLSIAEMARMTELPKSTLHRMVVTLESEGFLRRVDNSQHSYSLGLSLLELGYLVEQRLEIRKAAFSSMTKLRDQVNEAVNLIVVDGNEAVYIEKVDTSHPVRVYTRVGRRAPLYAGACPRILLSYMDDQEIEQLFNKFQWQKIANGTIVDKDLQLKMIAQARESGYTVSYNELENGSAAVAMPIRDYTGKVIAGLSIAGPIDRFDSNRLPSLIQELKIAVNEISRNMGFRE